MRVWGHIVDCLKNGGSCALVTVARVEGSTPREEGTRMVVRPDTSFYGTIGGGTLEFEAIRKAATAAREAKPAFIHQSVSLGPDLGQCCGGRAKLTIEVLTSETLTFAETLAAREETGSAFGTIANLRDGRLGHRRVLEQPPESAMSFDDLSEAGTSVVTERFGETRRPLYLFGAGHVGKALVLAMAPLPFAITWIDSRAGQFPGRVPANVSKVCVENPSTLVDTAPENTFILAMTHSHALDEDIMARALLRQRFAYCGVIGSKTKRARFQRRMKARGLDEALVSKMVCPVGNTAIKSKHPAAIAAGIVVDLLERDETLQHQAFIGQGLAQKITLGQ